MSEHSPLKPPGSLRGDAVAQEMIRFWLQDNTDHVALMVGGVEKRELEPQMWGFILADIAKHVTKALRELDPDGPGATEVMTHIMTGFENRLRADPHLTGTLSKEGD